ncbi:hypothetical protein ABVY18_004154 [Vibrio parahaemolyticus]|nr:hypothetical protein [Vibrio parahaemolyticus]EJC7022097.1 hypothetical protein [Vibrio parahaemolyticus]EJG0422923.1 hypothetical protein [Vibrio parahaemolyticus]EKL9965968.1 hypothetical protein [Vibrio parahaemolyticus]
MKDKIKKLLSAIVLYTIGFSIVSLVFFLYFIYLFPVSMRQGTVDILNGDINEIISEMYSDINKILSKI